MGLINRVMDGLANVVTGMGTTADKSTSSFYHFAPMTPQQAEAAYRTSWLTRKIVDVPPFDMTREWRDWQAPAEMIGPLEVEEKRLCVRDRVNKALRLARLYGGGVVILGVQQGLPSDPIAVDRIRKGQLSYVHAMSRHQIAIGPQIMDPASPWFGQPAYYEINGANGSNARIHPSRVIAFVGQPVPEGSTLGHDSWFWGDPIMQVIGDPVKNADRAQAGFAALIEEASVDVIAIPDLMSSVGSAEYEARFLKRMEIARLGKSLHRALIIDGGNGSNSPPETWQTRQVNWAGMPDILSSYLNIVAGAADIPITRLLGQSPKGLQSTGDGEERDYISMIMAQQEAMLRPALDRLDEALIRSALGTRPPEVGFTFAPLAHSDPKELAEIDKLQAETVAIYSTNGLVPTAALEKAAQNRMVESGQWPGLDAALVEAEALAEVEPPVEDDPSNVVPLRRAANDAREATAADFGIVDEKGPDLFVPS